jgi:hypothetical protein
MRDRLIELLDEAKDKALETIGSLNNGFAAWYADYLLAEGVILPPCKVGDVVYFVSRGKIIPMVVNCISFNGNYQYCLCRMDAVLVGQ